MNSESECMYSYPTDSGLEKLTLFKWILKLTLLKFLYNILKAFNRVLHTGLLHKFLN